MTVDERFASLAAQPLSQVGNRHGAGALASLLEIARHRQLLGLLIRRDLKSRYKDSSLGFLWALVRPLTQLLIYYVVIGQFLNAERGGGLTNFAIYVFAGLTAYGLLSEIIAGGTSSIVNNAGLVKKVYLPREIFPLAAVGGAMFNFLVQLGVLLLATLAIGVFPIHADLVYFLPGFALLVIFGTALALLLSALNVYLRDIQYLTEVVLLLLLWASPVVYGWGMVRSLLGPGVLIDIYTNNPITLAVLSFQRALWITPNPVAYPDDLMLRSLIACAVGLALMWVAQRVFSRLQGNFAQAL